MHVNTGLKVLAAAIGVALSGAASAQIFTDVVNISDLTQHTSFSYDTGLNTGADPVSYSIDLSSASATSSAYSSYAATVHSGDFIQYSISGLTQLSSGPNSGDFVLDTTGTSPPVASGSSANQAIISLATWEGYASGGNPLASGQADFEASNGNALAKLVESGAIIPINALVSSAAALPGNPMSMYNIVVTDSSQALNGNGVATATYAGQWNLNGSVLTYGSAAVPLPAPVLLLLSGLGFMGVVARRRQAV